MKYLIYTDQNLKNSSYHNRLIRLIDGLIDSYPQRVGKFVLLFFFGLKVEKQKQEMRKREREKRVFGNILEYSQQGGGGLAGYNRV